MPAALDILAWGQASFGVVVAAVSAVLSGSFAARVLYAAGASVNDLKYHLAVFVGPRPRLPPRPLLVFSGKLAHCRFESLLDFGMLAGRHDHAFDDKWIRVSRGGPGKDPRLSRRVVAGGPGGRAYEHVHAMKVVPIDRQALLVLVAAAAPCSHSS